MSRIHLDGILKQVAERNGNIPVYYKPPSNMRLKYPCIVYSSSGIEEQKANNTSYLIHRRYEVTYLTQQVDHEAVAKDIADSVPYGYIIREYESDGIQHTVIGCADLY